MNKFLVFTAIYDDDLALTSVFDTFSQAKDYTENWFIDIGTHAARYMIVEIKPDNSFETVEVS